MRIVVNNAYANNLKNISVEIPIGQITALTGVSGSGKSSLLRDVIGAYGTNNYTRIASKTVKDGLLIKDTVEVDSIDNLPNTILIDVKSSVSNPVSTVSTVSGIHEMLRNLFVEYGNIRCVECGETIKRDYSLIDKLVVDLKIDDLFDKAISYIEKHGSVSNVDYFDKEGKATSIEKKKALATVYFSLDTINEKNIRLFNKEYSCAVYVISDTAKATYDFIKEIECANCNTIVPNLIRSRMSYTTSYDSGGGACRCCNGTGKTTKIKAEYVFENRNKGILEGATRFVTSKGIKYSNVTEKLLGAIYKKYNIGIETPIQDLPKEFENNLLYGIEEEIVFTDRIGGKKSDVFEGIISYLDMAYRTNKGGDAVSKLVDEYICEDCRGSRFDKSILNFEFCGKSINSLMEMSLNELGNWCKDIRDIAPEKSLKYIGRIIKETNNYELLSCGHLALLRHSNTLSGGELQRIRICALLNSDIHGLCYLLDEPSSGLHYSDIENLAKLLKIICDNGNTIIMVEHNKKLLSYCDYFVDLGPLGGKNGGNLLFSSTVSAMRNYDTDTTRVMQMAETEILVQDKQDISGCDYLQFQDLTYNNLKSVSVGFPKAAFTVVCGISGSGKSTFVKNAVYDNIIANPIGYGFDGVNYLGQASKINNNQSTVASLVKIADYISKLFEKAAKSKIKKNSFMLGSKEGKCICCGGKGKLFSEADELIGLCDHCGGYGFETEVLKVSVDGLSIYDFYNLSIDELGKHVNDSRLKKMAELGGRLGVGYLTLGRQSKTMSKGELQRVSLMQVLLGNEKNKLYILDEPSKGLHNSDVKKLVSILREITKAGNTVLAVEHNPEMIKNADYVIEFGGTGASGGHILFKGEPKDICGTPTANMLVTFSTAGIENHSANDKKIRIVDDKDTINYEPYCLYYDKKHKDALLKAAKKSKDDFLSVAIPNNSMFSRLDRNIIESDTPIMMVIDFKERVKYNVSISEAIGIRSLLSEAAVRDCSDNTARYIFDLKSPTGKCVTCKGAGKSQAVEIGFFLQNGELSANCKRFLKNSTDYAKISKLLKKDGYDITKNIEMMTEEEQRILFWGNDLVYDIEGKNKRWEGIIPYFIQYHNYYSDSNSDAVFRRKMELECPACNGRMVKDKYSEYKCYGMTYGEWMSNSIGLLANKIKGSKDKYIKKIFDRLEVMCNLGMGDLLLRDEIISMDEVVAAKLKLASIYCNQIFDLGLVISNMDVLKEKEQNIIRRLLDNMTPIATIWIV